MDGSGIHDVTLCDKAALDALMPMHLRIGVDCRIMSAGPTLAGIAPQAALVGMTFDDACTVLRPRPTGLAGSPGSYVGRRLHVALRAQPGTVMRGHLVALPDGSGWLMNLSFGIGAVQAVRDHNLTSGDFAPTDLTVELLYLAEVKAAVTAELAALNRRLDSARQTAETQALTDPLTGLANRRAFDEGLADALYSAGRGQSFALVHLDLDYFKSVNDTLGHAAGDAVLARVAALLRAETRRHDLVARVGGDEFMLILRQPAGDLAVAGLCRRIIAGLEVPVPFEGTLARISGSLGVVLLDDYPQGSAETLIADADTALYAAKRAGRGRVFLHRAGSLTDHGGAAAA
jgi:diguanylate cyclase (GGDEF)-like protein